MSRRSSPVMILNMLEGDMDNQVESPSVEITRSALVAVIDESWQRVQQLISPSLLSRCETELKGATSLLVLATVRKAADINEDSRKTVQRMFHEADINNDGQITFMEWFEWLAQNASYFNESVNLSNTTDGRSEPSGHEEALKRSRRPSRRVERKKQRQFRRRVDRLNKVKEERLDQLDPMVLGLSQVLGHAVCTLQIAARLPGEDPSYLSAAFVAGGTIAGVMDEALTRTMLARLSPRTRDLVAIALALEASSMAIDSSISTPTGTFEELDAVRASAISDQQEKLHEREELDGEQDEEWENFSMTSADVWENMQGARPIVDSKLSSNYVDVSSRGELQGMDVIQTVKLSSIPLTIAPTPPEAPSKGSGKQMEPEWNINDMNHDYDEEDVLEVELMSERQGGSDGDGVNSWLVDDEHVLESNDFATTAEEHFDTESKERGTFLLSEKSISPRSPRDLLLLRTEDFVANIATAPPEKEEKIVILSESEEFAIYDKASSRSMQGDFMETISTQDLERAVMESNSLLAPSDIWSDSNGLEQPKQQVQYGLALDIGTIDATLQHAGGVAADITRLRLACRDMDDNQSALLRSLIMQKSGGRVDILGLAMALRATRLQHASRLTVPSRHRLAMETLQLWAPLSFQVGVSGSLPELEVHSYVLLFPKSFASFINWYTAFRPIAKKLLTNFQVALETALREDPVIPHLASKVLIQSRLKSPSSAFKKMVKSPSKQREQLHDMLGVRVIISNRMTDHMESMVSVHFDMNVYEKEVNTEYSFDFDEIEMEEDGYGRFVNEEDDNDDDNDEKRILSLNKHLNDAPTPLNQETCVVAFVSDVVRRLHGWDEDTSRFKNYIENPKSSGYQSMHMTLIHKESAISLEVQLRSMRMHMEAEFGRASHTKYKALALPASVGKSYGDANSNTDH